MRKEGIRNDEVGNKDNESRCHINKNNFKDSSLEFRHRMINKKIITGWVWDFEGYFWKSKKEIEALLLRTAIGSFLMWIGSLTEMDILG